MHPTLSWGCLNPKPETLNSKLTPKPCTLNPDFWGEDPPCTYSLNNKASFRFPVELHWDFFGFRVERLGFGGLP